MFSLPRKSYRLLGYGDTRKCSTARRKRLESTKRALHLTDRETEAQREVYSLDVASLL